MCLFIALCRLWPKVRMYKETFRGHSRVIKSRSLELAWVYLWLFETDSAGCEKASPYQIVLLLAML